MKRIAYVLPVKWLRGNISGRQDIDYNGKSAYGIADGDVESSSNYQSRLVAKVARVGQIDALKYFQVRTRTSVNMTPAMRRNLALMGGAGALFASLISDKTSAIYTACLAATPRGMTMRAFITPILREGLAAKQPYINIANGVTIVNPWVSSETPNVPVRQAVLDKFMNQLTNS